jgi:hypothetical protein
MVTFISSSGRYLQAHTDGEMHASVESGHVGQEETWYLVEVDKTHNIYALRNYSTNKYMSKDGYKGSECLTTNRPDINLWEKFEIIPGAVFGLPANRVAIKSLRDGTFLGANGPGNDTKCGGEVASGSTAGPLRDGNWPGWWIMAGAAQPPSNWCTGPFGFTCKLTVSQIGELINYIIKAWGDHNEGHSTLNPEKFDTTNTKD